MKFVVHTDGACLGNPGRMGLGVVLARSDGSVVEEHAVPFGQGTNNMAELSAVRFGLERAHALGGTAVDVFLDSEWSVRILSGEYQLRQERLRPMYDAIKKLITAFESVSFTWIPREENSRADALSKQGAEKN